MVGVFVVLRHARRTRHVVLLLVCILSVVLVSLYYVCYAIRVVLLYVPCCVMYVELFVLCYCRCTTRDVLLLLWCVCMYSVCFVAIGALLFGCCFSGVIIVGSLVWCYCCVMFVLWLLC